MSASGYKGYHGKNKPFGSLTIESDVSQLTPNATMAIIDIDASFDSLCHGMKKSSYKPCVSSAGWTPPSGWIFGFKSVLQRWHCRSVIASFLHWQVLLVAMLWSIHQWAKAIWQLLPVTAMSLWSSHPLRLGLRRRLCPNFKVTTMAVYYALWFYCSLLSTLQQLLQLQLFCAQLSTTLEGSLIQQSLTVSLHFPYLW